MNESYAIVQDVIMNGKFNLVSVQNISDEESLFTIDLYDARVSVAEEEAGGFLIPSSEHSLQDVADLLFSNQYIEATNEMLESYDDDFVSASGYTYYIYDG